MFPDKIPALYYVRWLTTSRIILSTHGFWLENVLIVTACSVSVLTKLNATSVYSLTSDELARNMSQSTSSRAACSIASEWEDQHITSLSTGGSWTILCLYSGVRKMVRFAKSRQGTSFVGILKLSVARIQCIRPSSWTGYMLVKVRHDLLEVGFVKVPRDDRGSVRVFVDVAAELIVEFGQSQASVCLWWNVNDSNDDWWRREPCFSQTKDVTVPNVLLETYPGSKIVHLILQGLDISEHNTR